MTRTLLISAGLSALAILGLLALAGTAACTPCAASGEQDEGGGGGGACYGGLGGSFSATPPAGTPAGATCSTGVYWQGGNQGTEAMRPGVSCVACHNGGEGPSYFSAGTVMGAANDADDCQGTSAITVTLTDANGVDHTATTNEAGNFFFRQSIPTPYTAKVTTADGKTRAMLTAQTVGDCMSCHTSKGANAAPGRILTPQ